MGSFWNSIAWNCVRLEHASSTGIRLSFSTRYIITIALINITYLLPGVLIRTTRSRNKPGIDDRNFIAVGNRLRLKSYLYYIRSCVYNVITLCGYTSRISPWVNASVCPPLIRHDNVGLPVSRITLKCHFSFGNLCVFYYAFRGTESDGNVHGGGAGAYSTENPLDSVSERRQVDIIIYIEIIIIVATRSNIYVYGDCVLMRRIAKCMRTLQNLTSSVRSPSTADNDTNLRH